MGLSTSTEELAKKLDRAQAKIATACSDLEDALEELDGYLDADRLTALNSLLEKIQQSNIEVEEVCAELDSEVKALDTAEDEHASEIKDANSQIAQLQKQVTDLESTIAELEHEAS